MNKRIIVLSGLFIGLLTATSLVGAEATRVSNIEPVSSVQVFEPAKEVKESSVEALNETPSVAAPVIVETPKQSEQIVAPQAPEQPTVKTFKQYLTHYGLDKTELMEVHIGLIKQKYPERFTDDNIEASMAYIANIYLDTSMPIYYHSETFRW